MSEVALDSRSALLMEETRFHQRGDVGLQRGGGVQNVLESRDTRQEVDRGDCGKSLSGTNAKNSCLASLKSLTGIQFLMSEQLGREGRMEIYFW